MGMAARPVIVTAYACHPSAGSEGGAGWAWTHAIQEIAPVWLYTRAAANSGDFALEEEIARRGWRVKVIRVPNPFDILPERNWLSTYIRYLIWIVLCKQRIRRDVKHSPILLMHHVTYANDWLPPGIPSIDGIPTVWGPVAGSPSLTAPTLGARSRSETVRELVGALARRTLTRKTPRRMTLCLGMNHEVGDRLTRRGAKAVRVRPNCVVQLPSELARRKGGVGHPARKHTLLYAGHLTHAKGVDVLLRAWVQMKLPNWNLLIVGSGPLLASCEAVARHPGVQIEVREPVSRSELLKLMCTVNAFVTLSLREGSSWSVAEAASLGLPVLSFPIAGCTDVADHLSVPIDPTNVAGSMSAALEQVSQAKFLGPPVTKWTLEALENELRAMYSQLGVGAPAWRRGG